MTGAFTTRGGGVSTGPWAGLDLATHVGDDTAAVARNRQLLESRIGAPIAWADQVHGAEAHVVTGPPGDPLRPVARADALVTGSAEVAVGVLVADCVPVLLADPVARVVSALHAGRRGLVSGVVQNAVAAMRDLGADPGRLRAAIGPCVCGACYEVPADMRDDVASTVPAAHAETSWGTPSLDLPAGVAAVLDACGVRDVQRVERCTMSDAQFFSHRLSTRRGEPTGRFAGVIRLTGVSPRS
ncbi:peptidoglycan editing factor PgeF [Cellulomonas sp. P24]|uniref:peptidoglycan editing factor PgeF n=1 Tax=Cellulomonas sp. P24 TaxID=2885206 RepID=UPI00216B3C9A|nr:peptidoglycan editing factor PgeF [Cellulomonas sp. P24]MCR6491260.1 peptidoglycan editing factor PgeF [Cellulomonas sp. P24]